MEEGTIATWHKKVGDTVKAGDILVEIETDKATMEYEAYEDGVLTEILVQVGETVAIGTPIARLDNGKGEAPAAAPTPAATTAAAAVKPEESPTKVVRTEIDADRVMASPLVRRLAREHAINLATIRGTGPGGRVIRADIDEFVAKGGNAPAGQDFAVVDEKRGTEAVPLSSVRRVIARRLSESARTIPHFYVTGLADAELLVQMRTEMNTRLAAKGEAKVSLNDLIVKASAVALREHPLVNVSWVDDASTLMHIHHRVNIGVAVASGNGLVVPVITDVDQKSASEVGAEIKRLAAQANGKGLSIEQMTGGTFTISNLGMYGVEEFTAIINPPEGAILAVGGTKKEAVVVNDEIQIRHQMRLTLSADHRIIDGALAAEFMRTLTQVIENPWRIGA
jgi:pyruvate dehydrogenase E2 component (dihydrolipoamide acetyltransferase)